MPALERQLAPVPSATYAQPGISAATQHWVAQFNVACWVRCRVRPEATLRLLLRWRDGAGKPREVEVDRAVCRQDGALLLSALCEVAASGRIEEMTVWLVSEPACELVVDELFVQRAGAAAAAARPLISAR